MTPHSVKHSYRTSANPLPWGLLVVALLVGVGFWVFRNFKPTRHPARPEKTLEITLSPPIPPPPPKVEPPPTRDEPPVNEEMIVQEPVPEDEPATEEPPPELPAGPDLGLGTPGGTGPAIGGGAGGNGTRIGGNRLSAGRFGVYAAKVQSTIREALANHPFTRSATPNLQVQIWVDASGRIRRARLVGSSGSPAVDQAIRDQVLTGLQLPQPPPADMPMPIHLRIAARKPGN